MSDREMLIALAWSKNRRPVKKGDLEVYYLMIGSLLVVLTLWISLLMVKTASPDMASPDK